MSAISSSPNLGSVNVHRKIRVETHPVFLPSDSNPQENTYYFTYKIKITNEGKKNVQLISRHWIIINGDGEHKEVRGMGVAGKSPHLEAGESFAYSSYCPMDTEWGTMEGSYTFQEESGRRFDVPIPRFYLTTSSREEPSDFTVD